jgi:capsule polysaccharide modification protein KpsS
MEDYILSSGIYGTTENRVAIAQANKGGKLRYVLGRIFLPYSRLILYYPNLKKHPILYPFYQVKRWFRIVFTKDRKNALTEIRLNSSVSEDKTARLHTMCEELSLL